MHSLLVSEGRWHECVQDVGITDTMIQVMQLAAQSFVCIGIGK
jgi:hypothetical protein